MMPLAWSLTEVAALLLVPDEREAVLGDLAEAQRCGWRGLQDVLALVTRRQLLLWADWRPWLSGLGLALPSSFLLMGASLGVSTAWISLAGQETPDRMWSLIRQLLLLAAWAWSGGLVVGRLSRQTIWASALLCFAPCLFCFSRFRIPSLSRGSLLLFLLPAAIGVMQGVRAMPIRWKPAFLLAVTTTAWMVFLCRNNHLGIANWFLIWPMWYLAWTARPATGDIERS